MEQALATTINAAGNCIFVSPFVPHQPIDLGGAKPAQTLVARNDASVQAHVTRYSAEK